ncbi:hypothetical protein G9A89_000428 [Geosiphon pyriformis]|nr:hypothetical protein G9A89_000428 [Geosiphon pyriformis]
MSKIPQRASATGGSMARKKVHKGVFHGPAGGSFAQKKKVVVGNVKHSDDERDVSLNKPVSGGNMFCNVDGESSDSEGSVLMAGVSTGFLLGLAANTPQAKGVVSGVVSGSPLGLINYNMDKDAENLPFSLNLSLSKRWIDPKVVKTPVEVAVKKSYALDINLLAVKGKSTMAKTQAVRKIFSVVNGFGGATTPSKFEEIIRSTFTSEKSMNKAVSLAEEKGIKVNSDLKRQGIRSDQAVMIKKIPMDMPKDIIVATKAVVEFAKLGQTEQLASKWSFLIGKNSVHVAKAVRDHDIWASRDCFRALLFTLLVGTTAHNLSNLLNRTGGRTCIINHSLNTGNRVRCTVVGFESENDLNSAFLIEPVFGGVHLSWARLDLVRCGKCGHLGHSALEYNVSDMSSSDLLSFFNKRRAPNVDCLQLAKLYAKKNVVSLASPSGGSPSGSGLGVGFSPPMTSDLGGGLPSSTIANSSLNARLVSLEHSLKLLAKQVSGIVRKLSFVELVPMVPSFGAPLLVGSVLLAPVLDSNMALNGKLALFTPHSSSVNLGAGFMLSSLKVLTTKVGGLESKMSALKASIVDHYNFDGVQVFISGLDSGCFGSGVAIVMNNSLAKHVYKVSEAGDINSFIAKAVNESSFVVLDGNFNEDGARKSASFKKCFDLGLVNALSRNNSRGVVKTIDYMFIFLSLINTVIDCGVTGVENFFDTDHKAVSISVGLSGLLDFQLNSMCKQANKDHWKFDFGDASKEGWNNFKGAILTNGLMCSSNFAASVEFSDLDAIWEIVHKIIILSVVRTFKKKWFKDYDKIFTKSSSRFHKLELLVSKLVKASYLLSNVEFASLLNTWERLDINGASVVKSLFLLDSNFNMICLALAKARKSYRSVKLLEFRRAEEFYIRLAIDKRMESFESDKGHTIRSVLEHPFRKVALNHLVVGNELILESSLVKARVNGIMKGWTRKRKGYPSNCHNACFQSLEYVFNSAFSNVMCPIGFNELFSVVSGLPESKTAGLSEISNKLWKHCNKSILDMLLVLLNSSLIHESTARKILSDKILLAYSTFDVLHGDNFSVLKGTITQSPIFAIGSVIEDALKKNHELWLVLQNILVRIKMCSRFIRFFGGIHSGRINRVMTNFGLMDEYEVFLPLLWRIFYDLLLCEVKRQANGCDYRLNFHFIFGSGCTEFWAGVSSFFTVGSSQSATQHILNVANEFFDINNILINNDKTVAIPINCDGTGLSKPSLAKVHSGIWFFSNLVLKKAVFNKQFSYLVLVVLFSIVGYRTQFSYISISACRKWDTWIHKDLRSKSGLLHDFPNNAIYHPSLYGLKTFEQVQAESKLALVVSFANSCPVHVKINPLNNFLAGVVHIFSGCNLSLGGSLVSAFCQRGGTPMSLVLGELSYVKNVSSLWHYGIAFKTFKWWKWLDPRGPVPVWFELSIRFLGGVSSLLVYSTLSAGCDSSDVLRSYEFGIIGASLFNSNVGHLSIYTDGSLSDLGSVDMRAGAAVFFKDIGMGLGVGVSGLMSSTLTELKAIALVLECIPFSCLVNLFSDSQTALDACKLEMELVCPDFRNWCWIKHHHIVNVIHHKNLRVNWCKVKGHSGVLGNEQTDKLAKTAALSGWHLLYSVNERYLRDSGTAISGNSRHFVQDVFRSVHRVHWEVSCDVGVVAGSLRTDIDWFKLSLVWHPDSHITAGFTNKRTTGFQTYFMKTLHHQLSVAMCKWLYDKHYPSVVCLFCGNVEVSDHAFSCSFDANGYARLLNAHVAVWGVCSGLAHSSSSVSQLLFTCVSNVSVSTALCKGFVFKDWFHESVFVFRDSRIASQNIVAFVREFSLAFWEDIWLVCAKHHVFMEKNELILCNESAPVPNSGLSLGLSSGMTQLLGVVEAIGVSLGFYKSCLFFSGIGGKVSVHIGA